MLRPLVADYSIQTTSYEHTSWSIVKQMHVSLIDNQRRNAPARGYRGPITADTQKQLIHSKGTRTDSSENVRQLRNLGGALGVRELETFQATNGNTSAR